MSAEMSQLNCNDEVFMLTGKLTCRIGVHIVQVLFEAAPPHPFSNNIQHGKHPGLRPVYTLFLKQGKGAPAGATGVNNRCYTCPECKSIRHQTAGSVHLVFTIVPPKVVRMYINKAGRYIHSLRIDNLYRKCRIDILSNHDNLCFLFGS